MRRVCRSALVLAVACVAVGVWLLWRWPENRRTTAEDVGALPERFAQVYSLELGRALKRVGNSALIAGRSEYLARHEIGTHLVTDVAVTFRWSDDGLELQGLDFGSRSRPRTLARVLVNSLRVPTYMVAYDGDVGEIELPGDWVIGEEATLELMLKDLEDILERQTGEVIRFIRRRIERPEILVTGIYDARRVQSQEGQVDIFETQKTSGLHAGGRGTFDEMLRWLANLFEAVLVNDAIGAEHASVSWADHTAKKSYNTAEIERILENLSVQTGLTFECSERQMEVWCAIRERDYGEPARPLTN